MGLNDPQWGKNKGDSGPPDLDEVIRNVNKKINNIFGSKKGDGGDGGPDNKGPKPSRGSIILILGLLLVVWLASGFYIVDEGHRGVVLRLGAYAYTSPAGLRWHVPYPIEQVELVNVSQVRTVEIGYRNNVRSKVLRESLMLTDDENIVDIQFAVQYILNDPEKYLFTNRRPDDAVLQSAETAIRQVIGQSRMDFVLYEGREQVASETTVLMQEILDRYQIGIAISRVTMQNAQPPEQVQAAFDDAVKAGQDRERQKNEGQAYANDVIPRARGNAARLIEESQGYKERVIASAIGDASRFTQLVEEYSKAPGVTRERLYLDMMQEVLSKTSKIMVDQQSGANLLYLPLDELIGSSGNSSSSTSSANSGSGQQESSEKETMTDNRSIRSRDVFRGREREVR